MASRALNLASISRSSMLSPSFTRCLRVQSRNICSAIVQSAPSSTCKLSTTHSKHTTRLLLYRSISNSTRAYSTTSASTPLGTVADGAAGMSSDIGIPATLKAPEHLDEKELHIFEKLASALSPIKLEVQDISGGCGSMYGIEIVSEAFRGLNMLKQQRLVNEVLGEEIKGWHGVQLKTKVPE